MGHAGTLDSEATGLVIAAVGGATRLLQYLESQDKVYRFNLHLGRATFTGEYSGEVLEERECHFDPEEIEAVLAHFRGEIEQTPPMMSAIKINGQRASDLAMKGQEVKLKSRQVKIYRLEKSGDWQRGNTFALEAHVSKGTYVRSLGRDIGKVLGVPACVSKIRRLQVGKLKLEQAHLWNGEELLAHLISPLEVLDWPRFEINAEQWKKVRHGNKVDDFDLGNLKSADPAFLTFENRLVAMAVVRDEEWLQPRAVFDE